MSADAPEDDEGAALEPAAPGERVSESAASDAAASVGGAPEEAALGAALEAPDALKSSGEPRCAEHPERAAYAICERCGDNLCSDCRRASDGADRCAACHARMSAMVPWEDKSRSFARRIFESLDGIAVRPSRIMARLPTGKRGPAYGFLCAVVVVPYMALFVFFGILPWGDLGKSVGKGLIGAFMIVVSAWLGGLAAALVARLAGATMTAEQVGRAAAYASSSQIVGLALGLGSMVPLGLLAKEFASVTLIISILVTAVLTVALIARSMFAFARGPLQLEVARASAVAAAAVSPWWLPPIIVALAVVVVAAFQNSL